MSRRALRTNAGAPVIASRKALDHGPHRLRHRLLRGPPRRSTGDPGEVEQVVTFGLIELKGVRYGVEHGVRHPAEVAPLQAGVVLAADAGQHRDLTTAQPGHPALAALRGTPACSGVTFARREARNSRTSFRFSIRETVVGRAGRWEPLPVPPGNTPSSVSSSGATVESALRRPNNGRGERIEPARRNRSE